MSKHALTVFVAVVIGVSLLLYMFAFQVRESDVAVVLTFGKPSPKSPEAGYHFRLPWPIQEVRTFDNRVHVLEGRVEESYTKDRFNIVASISTGWQISDVQQFNRNFGRDERAIYTASNSLQNIIRDRSLAVIGSHVLADFVNVDPAKLQYDAIEDGILDAAAEEAENTYGMKIVMVKLRRLELPMAVSQKVFDRMIAERTKEAGKIEQSGKERAAVIEGEAEAKRQQIVSLAKAEAEAIRGEGEAKAAVFYGEFAKNPELAIYLRKIRALVNASSKYTTLMVDTTTSPWDLLVNPAPDVASKTGETAASGPATGGGN